MHVHVICTDGEAKYWLEPDLELANNHRLSRLQLKEIEHLIEEHYNEIKNSWREHFHS
jgi:Domain of unknown function (DUF4160)